MTPSVVILNGVVTIAVAAGAVLLWIKLRKAGRA
jgi:hypothetical protein